MCSTHDVDTKDKTVEIFQKFSDEFKSVNVDLLKYFYRRGDKGKLLEYIEDWYYESLSALHARTFAFFDITEKDLETLSLKDRGQPLKTLKLYERAILNQRVLLDIYKKAYVLENSSWNPSQPIQKLIEQLKIHGPHYVTAQFGVSPKGKATPTDQIIEDRPVLQWNGCEKMAEENHSVVIVGTDAAKKTVYFLDPNDGSDPKDMKTQKLYQISYEFLCSRIATLYGANLNNQDDHCRSYDYDFYRFCSKNHNNFALYNPSFTM